MICNMKSFNHVGKFHRHEGERVALLRKRFGNKTPGVETRNDERHVGHFCRPRQLPSSPYRSLLCLGRCHLGLILLLPSSRNHEECAKKQRSTREGALQARTVRERETIPVEEGPFCPAHPTRGFRRPWSH